MDIAINSVIKYISASEQPTLEVILWIESQSNSIITFELNNNTSIPQIKELSHIKALLISKEIIIIDNPNINPICEENITEKHKQIRDNRWNLIKDIVFCEPDIYIKSKRGKIIKDLMIKNQIHQHKLVYRYLRLYWSGGKTINSLLPNYFNLRSIGSNKGSGELKRGTPRKDNKKGINVTEDIRNIIKNSYKKFYNNGNELTLTKAYQKMLETYFSHGYYTNNQGILVPLIDKDNSPSFRQFEYWGKKMFSTKDLIISRKGQRNFELNHRSILGESTSEAFAPGRLFQVDATIADIYLVSRINPNWIIGRPVIYMVIDVFSRKIVGFYVGLEGPSWLGAMMAIYNTTRNKVELCKEYGISITDEDWMCNHLPENIIADRGEFESNKTFNLKANLGVNIKILPPFRADWKGIVEQNFRRFNNKTLHWLPGSIKKEFRVRGDEDYRLGALLNLHEFTQLIIHSILYFNSSYMNYYERDLQMIKDNVPPIPNELWNWGIKNRSGSLKTFSEDIIKLNLMPSKECSITERGLLFQNRRYSCQEAVESGIFEHIRKYGRIKTVISYDPRNPDFVYINEGNKFIKLNSLDKTYRNLYYEELECLHEIENSEHANYGDSQIQNTANLNANIEQIISSANKREKELIKSKKEKIENIRENRFNEKSINRQEEAWELDKKEPIISENKVVSLNNATDDEYVPRPKYVDIVTMDLESEDLSNG
ncbi:DNA-binding protein [Candidatus Clostridium stratigraminis]|uniref:DNA-binding protein n=1 Tax=Candidatus Clostridium stratigraminis TaxID=3381661 RepID=A0ABW8T7R1_9CLOT